MTVQANAASGAAPARFFTDRDYSAEKSIRGTVTRLFCEREDFCAGALATRDGDPIVKDCRFTLKDHVAVGESVTLRGAWEETKYGHQFVASGIEYPAPDMTRDGLVRYLSEEAEFHFIGPVKARALVEAAGAAGFDAMIRNEPERVAHIAKISMEAARELAATWAERQDVNTISAWLAEYGLTAGQIRKIAKAFGNRARAVLTENPYRLHSEIEGIGFLRNDEIALKMGVEKLCPERLRAGIAYLVNQAHEETGHTYLPLIDLVASVVRDLYLDDARAKELVVDEIRALATGDNVALRIVAVAGATGAEAECVGSARLYTQELDLGTALFSATCPPVDYSSVNAEETGLAALTDEQRQAVDRALAKPVSVITGGAGAGKSHTIRRIVETLRALELSALIAAPTGKAARRLQADGVPAETIHRMLGWNPRGGGGFTCNAVNPLLADCVIIDEVSMCAVPLLYALVRALRLDRTRLVLVGDYNQLPPIGPGNTLRDLVDNELVPVTRLMKCHRNAGRLKQNCHSVLTGHLETKAAALDKAANTLDEYLQALDPAAPSWSVVADAADTQRVVELLRLLQTTQFAAWGFDPLRDCQIITPQNPGPLGVGRLNLELQRVEQLKRGVVLPLVADAKGRPALLVGDKVMQIKNDYNLNLMNGTQGVVLAASEHADPAEDSTRFKGTPRTFLAIQFDDRDGLLEIRADENKLVLAYAVTVHKVQGSQYPCIVSIVHRTHSYMLSRNLLYTAVSRARYTSIVLGEPVGMRRAARTVTNMTRRTWTALYAAERKRRERQEATG